LALTEVEIDRIKRMAIEREPEDGSLFAFAEHETSSLFTGSIFTIHNDRRSIAAFRNPVSLMLSMSRLQGDYHCLRTQYLQVRDRDGVAGFIGLEM
jgi:hypothetical protein